MSNQTTKHLQFDPADLERKEPGEGIDYTPLSRVIDDETTDPDGVAARAAPDRDSMFPQWVFNDFELSNRMSNGGKWADGKSHLVPKESTVKQVMECHEQGMQPEIFYGSKVRAEKNEPEFVAKLLKGYRFILEGEEDGQRRFDMMRSIGDICNRKLAERAYQKYRLLDSLARANIQDGQMPDFVEKVEERCAKASAEAGVWCLVHGTLWLENGYKNTPRYYVAGQIRFALNDTARYLDTNQRQQSAVQRAESHDYSKMALLY